MWYCAAHAVLIGNSLTPQKVHKTPDFAKAVSPLPFPTTSTSLLLLPPPEEQQNPPKHFLNPPEDHAPPLNAVPVDKQWIFP